MILEFFEQKRAARDRRKLGEAIAKHDLREMAHFLEKGTREVDHLLMRPADWGTSKEMIPAGQYNDAHALAKAVGLQGEGLDLLSRYIAPPAPLVHESKPKGTWGI